MQRKFSALSLCDWDGITRMMDTFFNGRPAQPAQPAPEPPKEPQANPLMLVILAGQQGLVARYNGRLYRVTAKEIEVTR